MECLTLHADRPVEVPAWAMWERYLLDAMSRAAQHFVERYTREDGTLIWRDEWPGMDGSDDGYESFHNFALLYLLGGAEELEPLARRLWDAVTWQFTEYGQVYREFDAYYDWMHHGESSVYLYYLGLASPESLQYRQRAARFADMYTGNDPEAPNYDREHRLIRSPITGSRGPRFVMSAEDWVTHRSVLDGYPAPFEDLPGGGEAVKWTDDATFAQILDRINQRMARGDVPLNLTATSMIAHAYMYSGEARYRQWVLDYVAAWRERTARNNGIIPDNVGLSGRIGEHIDGKWWGGYYGWRWPHGANVMFDAIAVGCLNAVLLSGDTSHLDLIRSQIDQLWALRRDHGGQVVVPNKHLDGGWSDYRPPDRRLPILLFNVSHADEDLKRIDRLGARDSHHVADTVGKGDQAHTSPWFEFVRGAFDDYPERILETNARQMHRRLAAIRADDGDPSDWDVHHWQDLNPVICEGLVQLTLGGPMPIYHGGLLHCSVRYFDEERRRPGLPPGVAALVERVEPAAVALRLINTDPVSARTVIVQAGAFAEHVFTSVRPEGEAERDVGAPWVRVVLQPGAGFNSRIGMRRYARTPTYGHPWAAQTPGGLLRGRSQDGGESIA